MVKIEVTEVEVEVILEALNLAAANVAAVASAQNIIIALRGGILDTDDYQQKILDLSGKIRDAQNIAEC